MYDIIGSFHRTQAHAQDKPNYVPKKRWDQEMRLLRGAGLNCLTLYVGLDQWKETVRWGFEHGVIMAGSLDEGQIEEATAAGLHLIYWLGDEPQNQQDVDNAKQRWEQAKKYGLDGMISLNSTTYFDEFKACEWPVLFEPKFTADHVLEALAAGGKPLVYWSASSSYSDWYRNHVGLPINALGYRGVMPWATLGGAMGGAYDMIQIQSDGTVSSMNKLRSYTLAISDIECLDYLDMAIADGNANIGRGRDDLWRAVQDAEALRDRWHDRAAAQDTVQLEFRAAAGRIYDEIAKLKKPQ